MGKPSSKPELLRLFAASQANGQSAFLILKLDVLSAECDNQVGLFFIRGIDGSEGVPRSGEVSITTVGGGSGARGRFRCVGTGSGAWGQVPARGDRFRRVGTDS